MHWIPATTPPPETLTDRVLVYSNAYPQGSPMRFRMMNAQFVRVCTDATAWCEIENEIPSLDPNT